MTANNTTTDLRSEFAKLAKIGGSGAGQETWDAAVKTGAQTLAGDGPITPEIWVRAAQTVRTKCDRCHNGVYSWGACVNGRMTHSAPCFRCQGTGTQGQEDYRRNFGYDNHAIRSAFAGVFAGSQTAEAEESQEDGSESLARYKNRTYRLLWTGNTRYGRKCKLSFLDGSKEFWVAADAVTSVG